MNCGINIVAARTTHQNEELKRKIFSLFMKKVLTLFKRGAIIRAIIKQD